MAQNYRKQLGAKGENLAAEYLVSLGFALLERNYHARGGEIDLILLKDDKLFFVEVKTRKSNLFGPGESSVTVKKLRSLTTAIYAYLESHPESPLDWQIDLVVVEPKANSGEPTFLHFENLSLEQHGAQFQA